MGSQHCPTEQPSAVNSNDFRRAFMRNSLITLAILVTATSYCTLVSAKPPQCPGHPSCKDDDGGDDGGSGEVCTDAFPSFTFVRPPKGNKTVTDLMVSSSESCRTDKLAEISVGSEPAYSFSDGRGVVVWSVDSTDIWILRFTVDSGGTISIVEDPHALIGAISDPNFESVGLVRPDVSTITGNERISFLEAKHRSDGSGVRNLYVLNPSVCDQSPCTLSEADLILEFDSEIAVSDPNCGYGAGFDPTVEGFDANCLVPNKPTWNTGGSALYYTASSIRSASDVQWAGTGRLTFDGTSWSDPSLLVVSDKWDCEADAVPFGGRAGTISLDGVDTEIIAASTCVGFESGLRDQRIFFLDAEQCSNTKGWYECEATYLYSGQIKGIDPSWRDSDGNILYGGFSSQTLDSVRAFDPTTNPSVNDRELVSKGERSDSGT